MVKSLLRTLALVAIHTFASGFVMIGSAEPRLAGVPSQVDGVPEVAFVWDASSPEIKGAEAFEGGGYGGLSSEELAEVIIKEAMGKWNGVPGANIRLVLVKGMASIERGDFQHSIATTGSNLSTAAIAAPDFPEEAPYDAKIITDCDISIRNRSVEAKSLLAAVTRELGHCLGLGLSHTNYKSIMGYSRDAGSADLGADDMAGVIYLYPKDGAAEPRERVPAQCGTVGGGDGWYGGIGEGGGVAALLLALPLLAAGTCRRPFRRA